MKKNSKSDKFILVLLASTCFFSILTVISSVVNATAMDRQVSNQSLDLMQEDGRVYRSLQTDIERELPELGDSAIWWFVALVGICGGSLSGGEFVYRLIRFFKDESDIAIEEAIREEKKKSPGGYDWISNMARYFGGDLKAVVRQTNATGQIETEHFTVSAPESIKNLKLGNEPVTTPAPQVPIPEPVQPSVPVALPIPDPEPLPIALPTPEVPKTEQLPVVPPISVPEIPPSVIPPSTPTPEFVPTPIAHRQLPKFQTEEKNEEWLGRQVAAHVTSLLVTMPGIIKSANIEFVKVIVSPTFRRYLFKKSPGWQVKKIRQLIDDVTMFVLSEDIPEHLRAKLSENQQVIFDVSDYIYLDIGRRDRQFIKLDTYLKRTSPLGKPLFGIGVNIKDEFIQYDLSTSGAQFLMIGASPGGGKSELLKTGLYTLCYHMRPEELQIVLMDTKGLTFPIEPEWFGHLNVSASFPVGTDLAGRWEEIPHPTQGRVAQTIEDVKRVMEYSAEIIRRRNELFKDLRCKNLQDYNKNYPPYKLPFFVGLQDELQHAERQAKKVFGGDFSPCDHTVERSQVGRSAGFPEVAAAQNPSAKNLGSDFPANFPNRVAAKVSDVHKSRIIIGNDQAVNLMGQGDILFLDLTGTIQRLQVPEAVEADIFPLLGVNPPSDYWTRTPAPAAAEPEDDEEEEEYEEDVEPEGEDEEEEAEPEEGEIEQLDFWETTTQNPRAPNMPSLALPDLGSFFNLPGQPDDADDDSDSSDD